MFAGSTTNRQVSERNIQIRMVHGKML